MQHRVNKVIIYKFLPFRSNFVIFCFFCSLASRQKFRIRGEGPVNGLIFPSPHLHCTNNSIVCTFLTDTRITILTGLNWFSLSGAAENDVLGFIPVEPTHVTIVDLKMELTTLVTDANGIKDRAATFHVLQVDESSYCDSLSGFGLKGVPMEQNITTVGISCVSTFALRKVHNDGSVLHDAIVGVARGILDYGSLGAIELQMFYEALFHKKKMRLFSH